MQIAQIDGLDEDASESQPLQPRPPIADRPSSTFRLFQAIRPGFNQHTVTHMFAISYASVFLLMMKHLIKIQENDLTGNLTRAHHLTGCLAFIALMLNYVCRLETAFLSHPEYDKRVNQAKAADAYIKDLLNIQPVPVQNPEIYNFDLPGFFDVKANAWKFSTMAAVFFMESMICHMLDNLNNKSAEVSSAITLLVFHAVGFPMLMKLAELLDLAQNPRSFTMNRYAFDKARLVALFRSVEEGTFVTTLARLSRLSFNERLFFDEQIELVVNNGEGPPNHRPR
jgi:hypothetical protein